MTTPTRVGLAVLVVAAAFIAVPALRGPWNRFRITANEKLDEEFVVDNYKAEYLKLHDRKAEVKSKLQHFTVEKSVATKKLALAHEKEQIAKAKLIETGTSDLEAFNRAREAYETAKTEVHNLSSLLVVYANAIDKLTQSLKLIDANLARAKSRVDTLASKKTMVDTIKSVNSSVEAVNGVGEDDLALHMSLESLDDSFLRESIRLEALAETSGSAAPATTTQADAEAYLESIK